MLILHVNLLIFFQRSINKVIIILLSLRKQVVPTICTDRLSIADDAKPAFDKKFLPHLFNTMVDCKIP